MPAKGLGGSRASRPTPLRMLSACFRFHGVRAMMTAFSDPFDALFSLQRALDAQLASDWLKGTTTGRGPYPPINVFAQDDDFVAIVELPGVSKDALQVQAKESTIRISGKKTIDYAQNVSVHRRGGGSRGVESAPARPRP